jgi:hypothetical protein
VLNALVPLPRRTEFVVNVPAPEPPLSTVKIPDVICEAARDIG